MEKKYKEIKEQKLITIVGGKKINWGEVGGSCVGGGLLGGAFGGPGGAAGGCAGGVIASVWSQTFG